MEKIGLTIDDARELQSRIMTRKYQIIKTSDMSSNQAYKAAATEIAQGLGADPDAMIKEMNTVFGAMSEGGRGNKPPQSNGEETDANNSQNFMGKIRIMAQSGFIPYGKYLQPLIGDKSEQMSSYISFLKSEGAYAVEKNGYGWTCAPIETPEQAEKRKTKEAIDLLQRQIDELRSKLK